MEADFVCLLPYQPERIHGADRGSSGCRVRRPPGYGFFALHPANGGRPGARTFSTGNGTYTVQALHYWTGIDANSQTQLVGPEYSNGDLMLSLDGILHASDRSDLRLHICEREYDLSATKSGVVHHAANEKDYIWSDTDLGYDTDIERIVTLSVPEVNRSVAGGPLITRRAVSPPGTGDGWTKGESIEVTLTFSQPVKVNTRKGTPSVTLRLDGNDLREAGYAGSIAGMTLKFRYTPDGDARPPASAHLVANSLTLNGATIRSAVNGADAGLAHDGAGQIYPRGLPREDAGPTAAFAKVPGSHDGETAFTVELAFSAESNIASYATVRDSLLEVTGATVTRARRQTPGSDTAWVLTVRPAGSGDVTLTLPVRPCGEANAVCIGGKPIVRAATATVEGPPFTASFDGAPSEHDGSAFTLNFLISAEPAGLGYATVRDSLFAVTGGTVMRARRLVPGGNRDWALTVAPEGYGPVTLALVPTTDCNGAPGVCDARNPGGRRRGRSDADGEDRRDDG